MSVRQPVVVALAIVALAALLGLGVLAHAPNRLLSGRPLDLWSAFDLPSALMLVALVAAGAIMGLRPDGRINAVAIALIAGLALVTIVAASGAGARRLTEGAAPAARTSFGPGFWIAVIALGFMMRTALASRAASLPPRIAVPLGTAAAMAALTVAGRLDDLSLMKEYAARSAEFHGALMRHGTIALAALVPAIVVGAGLGLLAYRRAGTRGSIFAVLDTVQVIPAIAVFALLLTPFAALAAKFPALRDIGFGGTGVVPAVVAVLVYLLLPIARNVEAGLGGVDRGAIEAARGMGLSPQRILVDIEAPLALPAFMAGLRIAAVQAIGLAALAALVGGGGLGTFIFQGMGQFALDLVLLGVLPIAAMAAVVDGLLRLGERRRAW
jgi:osmoprotectant transport system permease protein